MARKIVFTSGERGIGQSTICAIAGCGLAMLNKKVVLLDLCIGKNNLHKILNLDVSFDIIDVLNVNCRLKQALVRVPNFFQLFCLPCATQLAGGGSLRLFRDLLNSLNDNFDFVLIDCPAWIGVDYFKLIFHNSEAIIVTTTDKKCVLATNNLASCVTSCGSIFIKLFVNYLTLIEKKRNTDKMIAKWLKLDLLGAFLRDKQIEKGQVLEEESICLDLAKNLIYPNYSLIRRYNV